MIWLPTWRGMTPIQIVQALHFQMRGWTLPDTRAEWVLWEKTCFPVCGTVHWVDQAYHALATYGRAWDPIP